MTKTIYFSAAAITLVLAGLFVFPVSSITKTSYAPLNGSLLNAPAEPQQTAGSANILNIPEQKPVPSLKRLQKLVRTRHKKPVKNAHVRKQRKKSMEEVKVVAVAAPAPSKQELGAATSQDQGDIPQYALEDIMEAFEKDPSKYPLKEAKTVEGITFSLSGLERKDKMFVLKAAIDNETGSDFFVKDFKIRSSGRILASQSLFRIIVESHSLREGYVLFENPEAGARVDIELREDGGNGRSINLPIVYQF